MKYGEFMDKAIREGRQPFSQRFGCVDFLGQKPTETAICRTAEDCTHPTNKNAAAGKIDFNDDAITRKEDDDSGCSVQERELVVPGIASRLSHGKNFPCPYKNCKKMYTSSYGLKYHMDHGHTAAKTNERRPYICRIGNCGKTYKNNNGLKYHIQHAHKGEYDETEYNI